MKKKNQMSHTNRYILLGLSIFCVLMMVLSSFSDKVGGPFKTVESDRWLDGRYERQFLNDETTKIRK